MQASAKPAAAPGDGAPASEDPALIKMSNKHTKPGWARAEEPAPTKLDDQHNTHAMPVRAQGLPASPLGQRVHRETARSPYSSGLRGPTAPLASQRKLYADSPTNPRRQSTCAARLTNPRCQPNLRCKLAC